MAVFLVVIAGNAVQAFCSTGPPPYMGQSDPDPLLVQPERTGCGRSTSTRRRPSSLRGRWAIEKPAVGGLPADPAAGPLGALPALAVKQRSTLALPLRGTPTDLAYDAATDRFLLTTQHGVYITDGSLGHVLRYTVVDPGFSVDLGQFAGAAVPRQQDGDGGRREQELRDPAGERQGQRGRELPLLPGVVRQVRREVTVAFRHGARPDDVHDVGRVRPARPGPPSPSRCRTRR